MPYVSVRVSLAVLPSLPTSRGPLPFLLAWHWLGLPLLSERPRAFQSGLECAGTLWSGARALNFYWIPGELREKKKLLDGPTPANASSSGRSVVVVGRTIW